MPGIREILLFFLTINESGGSFYCHDYLFGMSQRINVGIDLGTTNSAISRYHHGEAEVLRNPSGRRQLLPSVVAMKKDHVVVGEKAKEWIKRNPEEVFTSFKRKMGTSHLFRKPNGGQISPEELSALVLKELKQFFPSTEQPSAAVITIPASFDSVQSQATLRAGELAGFEEVKLLQEPIAASLAYANRLQDSQLLEGEWIVYDLGGGTFDVALIRIGDGEMTVVDHEGNNFLGGTDIDLQIVEQLLVPALQSIGNFVHLESELRSGSGRYAGLQSKLLILAEEAKIELSSREETTIELETEDEEGLTVECIVPISRLSLEPIVRPLFVQTLELVRRILDRNKLDASELSTVLLVGGTTYMPYIREHLASELGVFINSEADPTTVVAIGAAQYASSIERRRSTSPGGERQKGSQRPGITARFGHQKVTQDSEEYVIAELMGDHQVAFFRFLRKDGGFDTGLLSYTGIIRLYLPLLSDSKNTFLLRVYDQQQIELPASFPVVDITQGSYALQGQPLPLDICLEVDDLEMNSTRLEIIFPRNALLPIRKTVTRQISRSISAGSKDRLQIKVLEGDGHGIPEAALLIGNIQFEGTQLSQHLVKGSDVEVTLEISESRVLNVEAYLMMTDQTLKEAFVPEKRQVDVLGLRGNLRQLLNRLREELREAETRRQYEMARLLTDLEYSLMDLADAADGLSSDDVTEARYQLEDQMRKKAAELHRLTAKQEMLRVKESYFHQKRSLEESLRAYDANEDDLQAAKELFAEEKLVLASDAVRRIRLFTERIQNLGLQVKWKSSRYIRYLYIQLKATPASEFLDPSRADSLFQQGDEAFVQHNDHQLRVVLNRLFDLLPKESTAHQGFYGTGLS